MPAATSRMENSATIITDVIIAGAGMAGAAAACALAERGIRTVLIDPAATQPPVFRAEKIEPDQAAMLRELHLMDAILPECRRIHRIACAHNGRIWQYRETDEYGCFYHDMVNAVRRGLPESVLVCLARVTGLKIGAELQEAALSDGTVVQGRLLVLSTGAGGKLVEQLNLERRTVSAHHSVTLGFDLKPAGLFPGGADSLTYREKPQRSGIDYLTLFPVKNVLRANLFAYWDAKDPRFQDVRTRGLDAVQHFMPRLSKLTGPLEQISKVEAMPIHLYRTENPARPGLLLLGDVYQSVCPTTGTGLTKVLVDVQTMADLVPAWLATPGMSADKTAQFYACERKIRSDDQSLHYALYSRSLCYDHSLKWRLRRWKKYLPRWIASLRGPGSGARLTVQHG